MSRDRKHKYPLRPRQKIAAHGSAFGLVDIEANETDLFIVCGYIVAREHLVHDLRFAAPGLQVVPDRFLCRVIVGESERLQQFQIHFPLSVFLQEQRTDARQRQSAVDNTLGDTEPRRDISNRLALVDQFEECLELLHRVHILAYNVLCKADLGMRRVGVGEKAKDWCCPFIRATLR